LGFNGGKQDWLNKYREENMWATDLNYHMLHNEAILGYPTIIIFQTHTQMEGAFDKPNFVVVGRVPAVRYLFIFNNNASGQYHTTSLGM
jgi:hypothetical protein